MCESDCLTDERWVGLPLLVHRLADECRDDDVRVSDPILVLYGGSGRSFEVNQTWRRHWSFEATHGRFDLWGGAEYKRVISRGDGLVRHACLLPGKLISTLRQEEALAIGPQDCLVQFSDVRLRNIFNRLARYHKEGEPFGPIYTEMLSVALVDHLFSRVFNRREHSAVRPALTGAARRNLAELIENDLASPPGIADLALAAGRRTADFLRAFRESFGEPPHQYIMTRRIERAKGLLSSGMPASRVSALLGYSQPAHFSASFRQRVHMTPTEFSRATEADQRA